MPTNTIEDIQAGILASVDSLQTQSTVILDKMDSNYETVEAVMSQVGGQFSAMTGALTMMETSFMGHLNSNHSRTTGNLAGVSGWLNEVISNQSLVTLAKIDSINLQLDRRNQDIIEKKSQYSSDSELSEATLEELGLGKSTDQSRTKVGLASGAGLILGTLGGLIL